jgi:hypothetical protein
MRFESPPKPAIHHGVLMCVDQMGDGFPIAWYPLVVLLRAERRMSASASSGKPQIATMDDLTAQLDSLLRLYAADHDEREGDAAGARARFRKDLEPLVAQRGRRAVITALNKLADAPSRSVSVH